MIWMAMDLSLLPMHLRCLTTGREHDRDHKFEATPRSFMDISWQGNTQPVKIQIRGFLQISKACAFNALGTWLHHFAPFRSGVVLPPSSFLLNWKFLDLTRLQHLQYSTDFYYHSSKRVQFTFPNCKFSLRHKLHRSEYQFTELSYLMSDFQKDGWSQLSAQCCVRRLMPPHATPRHRALARIVQQADGDEI